MNNYKIKVNDEAESKETIELFTQLGYGLFRSKRIGLVAVNDDTIYADVIGNWYEYEGEELTLPQLRDLVVLHRNDPKDGNYSLFISDSQGELNLYKTADDVFYVFSRQLKGWDKSRAVSINTEGLKAIPVKFVPTDQGLISGADALRALADGEGVEVKRIHDSEWQPAQIFGVSVFTDSETTSFRLKPRTIKLEIEIPAPFEPKEGEEVWCLDGSALNGYKKVNFDDFDLGIGFWRTEEEIKQVVAALRGIKG